MNHSNYEHLKTVGHVHMHKADTKAHLLLRQSPQKSVLRVNCYLSEFVSGQDSTSKNACYPSQLLLPKSAAVAQVSCCSPACQ